MAQYTMNLGWDKLTLECDMLQASAPICYVVDGESYSTPYQTADARHRVRDAFALVITYLGREYYGDEDPDELAYSTDIKETENENDFA